MRRESEKRQIKKSVSFRSDIKSHKKVMEIIKKGQQSGTNPKTTGMLGVTPAVVIRKVGERPVER